MSTDRPDPYTVLGVDPGASDTEITAAYRRAIRTCHPDTPHPDRDRLAAVITAYRQLHDPPSDQATETRPRPSRGTDIPVHVHHSGPAPPDPDLRVGPVRRHPLDTGPRTA
jgi:hypothetical protein